MIFNATMHIVVMASFGWVTYYRRSYLWDGAGNVLGTGVCAFMILLGV